MGTEVVIRSEYRGGMHFVSTIGQRAVSLDYPLVPADPGAGPRPLEMLLACLATCAGSTVAALLRRASQPVQHLTVTARGHRRSEHPTIFTGIDLEFLVQGEVDAAILERVLGEAESRVCPVWAMLKPGTAIRPSARIEPD